MRPRKTVSALAATAAVAALLSGTAAADASQAKPGSRAASSCAPAWTSMATPSMPGPYIALQPQTGGSAVIPGDAAMIAANAFAPRGAVFTGDVLYPFSAARAWMLRWDGRTLSEAPGAPKPPLYTGWAFADGSFDSATDGWLLPGAGTQSGLRTSGYVGPVQVAEHWHGGRWTLTPLAISPDPAGIQPSLGAVASVSPNDAWAAGGAYRGTASIGTLIEHWDGTSWSIVPSPVSARPHTLLTAITAASATDVWAVGVDASNGTPVPLAEHWNGTAWSVIPVPPGNGRSALYAVSADGSGGVWVAGDQTLQGTANLAAPLIEHWNGTAWSVQQLPGIGNSKLLSIYAASPGDVWAGGLFGVGLPNVLLHWDGKTWTTSPVPGPREYGVGYLITGMSGTGPGDIWAAGYASNFGDQVITPVIAHLSCGSPAPGGKP